MLGTVLLYHNNICHDVLWFTGDILASCVKNIKVKDWLGPVQSFLHAFCTPHLWQSELCEWEKYQASTLCYRFPLLVIFIIVITPPVIIANHKGNTALHIFALRSKFLHPITLAKKGGNKSKLSCQQYASLLWYFRFSLWQVWRWLSSGVLYHVAW
jgi:hypothetical protein